MEFYKKHLSTISLIGLLAGVLFGLFYPQGTESLYMTFKAVIDPNVFSAIAQAIGKTLHLTYDYLNGNQVYDITGLASAYNYNALSSLGFGVGQGNVGGWDATNPFIY